MTRDIRTAANEVRQPLSGKRRRLVNPGGRVLVGECFWEHPPSPAEIAARWPGIAAGNYCDLAGLTDLAISAGFRPEWIETASLEEWDDFESGSADPAGVWDWPT